MKILYNILLWTIFNIQINLINFLNKIAPFFFSKLSYSFWWRNRIFVSKERFSTVSPEGLGNILRFLCGEIIENLFRRNETQFLHHNVYINFICCIHRVVYRIDIMLFCYVLLLQYCEMEYMIIQSILLYSNLIFN